MKLYHNIEQHFSACAAAPAWSVIGRAMAPKRRAAGVHSGSAMLAWLLRKLAAASSQKLLACHAAGLNPMCHALRQAALDLGEEQKQRLLAARTYLLAQMVEIIQERTLIISMLQARSRGPAWPRNELQCICQGACATLQSCI